MGDRIVLVRLHQEAILVDNGLQNLFERASNIWILCRVSQSIQIAKYPDWSWMRLPCFCQADIINLGIPRYHIMMHEPEQKTQNLDLHLNIWFPCLRRALHCHEKWCQFRFAGEDQLLCKQDRCVTFYHCIIFFKTITISRTGFLQEDLPETVHHFFLHDMFVPIKSLLLCSPLILGFLICHHLNYKIVVVKHKHIFGGAATTASNIVSDSDVFLLLRRIPEDQNNGSISNLLYVLLFSGFDPFLRTNLQIPFHQLEVFIRSYSGHGGDRAGRRMTCCSFK